ncbi:MAG: S-formylglutathione hydrolase, partial [Pandoraea sp.]|nr:S-formylglutathione hydrolase [Pandoraea sp.]
PWGEKAFAGYLGADRETWRQYDASELLAKAGQVVFPGGILIDQGLNDQFLESQLHPHLFERACQDAGQPLNLRRHPGYDHGYYFIQTFMADHLSHHAEHLRTY